MDLNFLKIKQKRSLFIIVILIVLFITIYALIASYFIYHFFPNTTIDRVNVSGKSKSTAEQSIIDKLDDYQLFVKGKEGKNDTISGLKMELDKSSSKLIENELKKQKVLKWPYYLFQEKEIVLDFEIRYNQNSLRTAISNLSFVMQEQEEPISAIPVFDGQQYTIQEEVMGNKVDLNRAMKEVVACMRKLEPEIDLYKAKCYVEPDFRKDSKEVIDACSKLNQYCTAKITYNMWPDTVIVDKTIISQWLDLSDDMEVVFDEDAFGKWLLDFSDKYTTVGEIRKFTAPNGRNVDVSGGTYGWAIDYEAEYQELLKNIQEFQVIEREPIYKKEFTAVSHDAVDWGNTYVDVDLTTQHMWYMKEGRVAFECDIVSGEPIPAKETPTGVYKILEKKEGKTLVGEIVKETGEPEYRTYVNYWMRVTWNGIGFHDADWQPEFGGNRYVKNGSHGCINMPVEKAAEVYRLIEVNTPVVIHY